MLLNNSNGSVQNGLDPFSRQFKQHMNVNNNISVNTKRMSADLSQLGRHNFMNGGNSSNINPYIQSPSPREQSPFQIQPQQNNQDHTGQRIINENGVVLRNKNRNGIESGSCPGFWQSPVLGSDTP